MRLQDGQHRQAGTATWRAWPPAARANGFAWDDEPRRGGARRRGRHEAGRPLARQAAAARQRRAHGRVHGVPAGERAALEDGAAPPIPWTKTTRSCASRRLGGTSTTPRAPRARALDDVVLWTRGGEITESTIANVVVELDGALYTPPATGALLPGVFREELCAVGARRGARDPQTRGRSRRRVSGWSTACASGSTRRRGSSLADKLGRCRPWGTRADPHRRRSTFAAVPWPSLCRQPRPPGTPALKGTQPSGCSFWRLAADGAAFYTVPARIT